MRYKTLGKTGLQVSVIGFGAAPLGNVYGDIDAAEGIRTVHAAIEEGINFFDVAPYYGTTLAETVLGDALRTVPRDSYILATKVGRYGAAEFDFSAARVIRSVDESLKRLQVEQIDLIQCHDIEFTDLRQIVEETLPALQELRTAGKVRYIGITGLPLNALQTVLSQAIDLCDTVLSYCHYTLADTTYERLFPFLVEQNLGVINASPLAMGLLTEAGPPPWHPAPQGLRDAIADVLAFCQSRGVDLSHLALQFVLAQPALHTTLVGMASRDLLAKNLRALETAPDPELIAAVRAILAPVQNLTWQSGLPENNGT